MVKSRIPCYGGSKKWNQRPTKNSASSIPQKGAHAGTAGREWEYLPFSGRHASASPYPHVEAIFARNLHAQCCSEQETNNRPIRFLLWSREYIVDEVMDQWYEPDHEFYKIRADVGIVMSCATKRPCLTVRGN